jgi:predicted dehydrogenase
MKVAAFDVSHWHFPLYLDALQDPGIEVVGISDTESFAGPALAQRLNCELYDSNESLLSADFDFALVFSRHSEMAEVAEQLITRGTPFLIEKPCGIDLEEVRHIRQLSERHGVYVTVPFIMRVGDLAARLGPAEGYAADSYQHLSFRFIVGPVARYERAGCGWMLDKRYAGGGSTLNLGVHFIDLISLLTGRPIAQVSAQVHTYRADVSVEELSVFTCRTDAGQIGVVETGYLYPSTADDQRDFAFSISHTSAYIRGYADQFFVKGCGQKQGRTMTIEYNTDRFYPVFLRRSWADLRAGRSPVAGLREAEHAVAVVEAGYRSASNAGTLEPVRHSF